METYTIMALVSSLFYVADRARERRRERTSSQAALPPDPPEFRPDQVERFTHVLGQTRCLDRRISDALPEVLSHYSAIPIDFPGLGRVGRAWVLQPLTPGAEPADRLLATARRAPGAVVLASLTVVLPLHATATKLILVCGPGGEALAHRDGRRLAVILAPRPAPHSEDAAAVPDPPADPAASTPAAPAPVPVPDTVAAPAPVAVAEVVSSPPTPSHVPPAKTNGRSKSPAPAASTIVVDSESREA